VLRAEVELANAKPVLIRARNTFRTSIDQLRQSIGYTNVKQENLRKTPEFIGTLEFTPAVYDLQTSLDAASANRPELLRLARTARAQERNIDIARSGYRPTLDVVGSYGLYKDSGSNRFRDSLDGWTVGLESTWAIFDGRATAGKVVQAKSQYRQADLQLKEQTLAVEVEVRTALSSLQEAGELAEAAVKVVEQAKESLRLADARYGAGSATQLDVLQAQVSLTQARDNQLQANYSYNVALANVRRAIGEPDTYAPDVHAEVK
jgi:outer membrane protein